MTIRLGVVGIGKLGYHHARILAQTEDVTLSGIIDIDEKKASQAVSAFKTREYRSAEELASNVDGVIIAVPTNSHHKVAKTFLEKRLHCLIEKPIAGTPLEAEELIAIAEKNGCILQVGHVERFNPAVQEMQRHVDSPVFMEANRLGPYDPRVSDIGVVMDLMIHDIDIVLSLVKEKVINLQAIGAKVFTSHPDIVKATLFFANGCQADLSASRITNKRFRKIRVFQPGIYISLDYEDSSLTIYKKKSEIVRDLRDITIIRPHIQKQEPLKSELMHFVNCIKLGRTPLVTGQHGRDAVELALEITRNLVLHSA